MIRIYIQGRELTLRRDTTMTVELNNALFASPDIEGDVAFSFTLPVEGNERLTEFAHLPQADGARKFPCTVYCNGGFNWNGELVVQKGGHDTLTAVLVINPYPEGFGKRKLTENHDGEILVSGSRETHNRMWEAFLTASVNDPDVKFAPFFNEEGYGSDNEDFGYWNGYSRPKIVNALWFDTQGQLIDSGGRLFSKAHNAVFDVSEVTGTDQEGNAVESTHRETNQLAFCPQIRIARLLEIWCRNAGYRFIDHTGEDFAATFLQSQKSLDGTMAQYETQSLAIVTQARITLTSQYNWYYKLEGDDSEHIQNGMLIIETSGWWLLQVKVRFKLAQHPGVVYVTLMTENADIDSGEGVLFQGAMTCSEDGDRVYAAEGEFRAYLPSEATMARVKAICMRSDGNPVSLIDWETGHYSDELGFELNIREISSDQEQLGFNIFLRRFSIPELLPEVTNSAFLKTMLETLGLCYYVSAKTKTIELVPYAMLKRAKSLDLTDCELTRESETTTPEETLRTFRLAPVKDEDYNEDLRLEDVERQLPDAYANHEHLVLRTETNTLYRAEKMETDNEQSWTEGWEEHSGNPDRLEVGSGDEDNREPSVKIPHQRYQSHSRRFPDTDSATGRKTQIAVADFTISSDLYNSSDKPSEIILTQYRGFRKRGYYGAAGYMEVKNEVMLPVWGEEFALKAKGTNSLGEKYIRPVLELLGHRTVTYKLRLPAGRMQAVEDLLRPSELEPERQTRFLIVRNVKSVPRKITFQIDNSIDDTVLCQIEAVKVY